MKPLSYVCNCQARVISCSQGTKYIISDFSIQHVVSEVRSSKASCTALTGKLGAECGNKAGTGAVASPTRTQTAGWQVRVPLRSRDRGQAEPQSDDDPASPQQQGRSEARPGNPAGGSGSGSELRKYETRCRCSTAGGQQ